MEINQAFTTLQKAGGIRAARIITDHYKKLSYFRVLFMARQLKKGVPVAKLIHQKWFYGLKFYTNKYTLDPRPDTETLVSAVISDCADNNHKTILDLGTGTGCIICSLIKNIHNTSGIAVDKSWRALFVAKKNIKALDLNKKIKLKHGSFFNKKIFKEQFDIIVSNPPYIAYGDSEVDIGASHDPKLALYAKDEGLAAYKAISENAKNWLKPNGQIYLEIGKNQAIPVQDIFVKNGWQIVRTEYDFGGIERVLVFKK